MSSSAMSTNSNEREAYSPSSSSSLSSRSEFATHGSIANSIVGYYGYDDNKRAAILTFHSVNMTFAGRLYRLQLEAIKNQYLFACFSTLGGAYHLCNHPKQALILAKKQETIGHRMGSTSLVIKSKVHQAVNFGLMGNDKKANRMFQHCKHLASSSGFDELMSFILASELWLRNERPCGDQNEHDQRTVEGTDDDNDRPRSDETGTTTE
jgi:hypothetical protein